MTDLITLPPEVAGVISRAQGKGVALTPEQAEDYIQACDELGVSNNTRKKWLSHLNEYDADTLITAINVKAQTQSDMDKGYISLVALLKAIERSCFPTDGYAEDYDYETLSDQIIEYEFVSKQVTERDDWGEPKKKKKKEEKVLRGYRIKESWLEDVLDPEQDNYS